MLKSIELAGISQIFANMQQKSRKNESGQGLVEYSLILVLVVVLLIVLLYFFGDRVESIYQGILDKIRSL